MKCEACGTHNVEFISGDYKTGKWSLQCGFCGDSEYWIPITDFNVMYDKWLPHMRRKRWFNEAEFMETLERYVTI